MSAQNDGEHVYPVTQTVLSVVGLVVFPWERSFDDYDRTLLDTLTLKDLRREGWSLFETVMPSTSTPRTLRHLVRNVRNATAHGAIKFDSEEHDLERVQVTLTSKDPNSEQWIWTGQISADGLWRFCDHFLRLVVDTFD